MPIQRIATYRPAWTSGGERVRGWDEDGTAVSAVAVFEGPAGGNR